MSEKFLILGSLGFIGSNFVRKIIYSKMDGEFVSVDYAISHRSTENLYLNRAHSFYLGNIADSHFLSSVLDIEKPDYIIHLANSSDPVLNYQSLHSLISNSPSYLKKLVFLSSSEVYGQDAKEDSTLHATSVSSASKIAQEALLLAHKSRINCNIVRACSVFGPRQPIPNLLPYTIKQVLSNQPILVQNGMQEQEWLYVDDLIHGVFKVLHEAPKDQIYNISANAQLSNLEFVQQICNILGKGHELIQIQPSPNATASPTINCEKIRKLGWSTQNKFKEALTYTVNWYFKNQWYLKSTTLSK